MVSAHSSPRLANKSLCPMNQNAAHVRQRIKRPSSRDSSSSSNMLPLGGDGELHDPSYTASLQSLKAQMEHQSPAWASLSSAPSRRRQPSGFSSHRRGSLNLSILDVDDQDGLSSSGDKSDAEERLVDPRRQLRRPSSASRFAAATTASSTSGASTSTRRGDFGGTWDYGSSGWSTSVSTPSSRPTSPRLVEFDPAAAAAAAAKESRRPSGSLRRAISKKHSKGAFGGASDGPSFVAVHNTINDWRGGFTGIVDVEASRSRRPSTDSVGYATPSVWISRPSSPVSLASVDPRSVTRAQSPPSADQTAAAAAAAASKPSKRRGSEGCATSTCHTNVADHARRLSTFAHDTLLRKGRSESDPLPSSVGENEARDGAGPGSLAAAATTSTSTISRATHSDEAVDSHHAFGVTALPTASTMGPTAAPAARPSMRVAEKPRNELLTPLDEDGAYGAGGFFAPFAGVAEEDEETQRPRRSGSWRAREQDRQRERACSHRLPLLGRRPSPRHVSMAGQEEATESSLNSAAAAVDTEDAMGASGVADKQAGAATIGDHLERDLRAMRRKMQHIGLGVRLKAMRAERSIKQRWTPKTAGNADSD
ncbi:unnamed protein product [Parajaminaea phylloscopi]